jgi:hypothetical protein
MTGTGKIIQAASRFGGTMNQDEKDRIFAEAIEQAAELVEAMLKDGMPPEDFPDHIRGMSPYAERD